MDNSNNYRGFRDLIVYQKAYKLSLRIFTISKDFPPEEKYSLIDQIRRSSRSIAANIAEAWPKRRYPKFFVSKLIDSLSEECETEVWLDTSKDLGYINKELHSELLKDYDEVRKMLISMIDHPEKFCR